MKKLLIIYVVLLYLMQLFLYVPISIHLYLTPLPEGVITGFTTASIVLAFIALAFGVGDVIYGVLKSFFPDPKTIKIVMIFKLILIPFFCVNFDVCVMIVGGLANPWLMLSIPLAVVLMVALTYLVLLATSVYSEGFMIYQLIKKERTIKELAAHIVLQLFFVLDDFSIVVLYIQEKKRLLPEPKKE